MSSIRHTPRQSSRDLRLHEPHALHPPPHHGPPPPPPPPIPHLNGNGVVPGTPASIPNGASHPHPPSHVSPKGASGLAPSAGGPLPPSIQKLVDANEQTWLVIGSVAEQMGDLEHAATAYENALRHNPMSIPGLTQVAGIARIKENYPMAVEYFQRVLALQQDNGEIWSALGHCYLMQDDLQKAYSAYQHALYSLPNPKENPKLWYGIGILYDRYGSLDNAEEAFSSVLKMDKDFDKSNEVLFRLGIIYKQQTKYDESLRCFDRILRNPPSPLANADIWFQIGHVYEQQGDHVRAREAYERVVAENPVHAKVLQQLGWLYHQDGPSFQNQDLAIQYLTKSLEADPSDAQSWYLLGRAYMAGQKYNKAYEAYQQAVYRDGRNPTFWCSIGVLYFQINQYRDALDAYSRAIRINPYIPEVWFDLGSLYESCNNQIGDAIDAYARAAELDPANGAITQRLHLLKHSQATGAQLPAAPAPQDVHPTAYASVASTPGLGGLPLLHVNNGGRPIYRPESRGPGSEITHHPSHISGAETSPAPPFRGGPPPPVVIDESRHAPSHAQLAPMDVDHIPHGKDAPYSHPPPTRDTRPPRLTSDPHPRDMEGMRGAPPHDSYSRPSRPGSIPPSPPIHASRARSPIYHGYPPSRVPVSTGPTGPHRSPHVYPREPSGNGPQGDREAAWDRREWERGRESSRRHVAPAYLHGPSSPPRAPSPRARSPSQTSPVSAHPSRGYWESRSAQPAQLQPRSPRAHATGLRSTSGDRNNYWQNAVPVESSPDSAPAPRGAPPTFTNNLRGSESPHLASQRPIDPTTEYKTEVELATSPGEEAPKRDRKRRTNVKKNERGRTETPKPYGGPPSQNPPFKVTYPKRDESAGPSSSGASGSQSRSAQPSPTSTVPTAPARPIDEDYDEGVAETLIGLASYRAPEQTPTFTNGPTASAVRPISSPSPSMRSHSHRGSISSTRSRASPPPSSVGTTMKRPLSPVPDDIDPKRTKVEIPARKTSPPASASSRPSPIPFRTQPSSHSPESRQAEKSKHPSYPSSPQLPSVLPLPPRPIGAGLSHSSNTLPPIATLSPASTSPSPAHEPERMSIDRTQSRSASPQTQAAPRGKFVEVMNPTEPSNNAEPSS
ncbi:TPR-like protein [Russula earlei]|uniref:TPR-like protein n=1 Tax=Russula earlei TaxID=71964 RepID=A0ACC0UKQ7_9AGAM|nr:TPR-like protein [Russula earlei]